MNQKITKEDELEIYKQVLRGKRQSIVARQFGITQGWVSVIYNNITKRNDENLAVSTALEFIGEYTRQHDYITMKQYELQELLESTQDEKLKEKIIMSQVALSEILLHSVSQRKFMQAVQEDTNALQAYLHTLPKPGQLENQGDDVGI
ncbi:MAG: hypothetical protein OER82_05835 [Nitrosopumilus sp.]|nr:hypothetical protein [Nitrosopumilus sp.]MDH3765313.1 hypothetical protein [Nitrosopumilus sp.]